MATLGRLRPVLRHPVLRCWGPVALVGVLAAGCASAGTTASTGAKASAASTATASGGGSADMSGMNMGTTPAAASDVKPVPTQVLGTAVWQGMKVTADAMTPVPFLIYNGTTMQEVKTAKNTSFHLMVLLNDAQTNVVIPYASISATITEGAKTPFNQNLWPMISRYMGPHYGNDVALPGAGTYQLTLLISPPVSARHLEYQDVWLTSHKVTFTFHWKPTS
jgi:uncharacterized protein involved in high-affinity Fe2+ transport